MDFSVHSMWHDTKANAHPFLRLRFVQAGRPKAVLLSVSEHYCGQGCDVSRQLFDINYFQFSQKNLEQIDSIVNVISYYFFTGKIIQGLQIFGSQSPPPSIFDNQFFATFGSQEVIGNR